MCLTHTEFFQRPSPEAASRKIEGFSSTPIVDRGILLGRDKTVVAQRMGRAMDWETDLIDAFEAIVHRDFPNPHRIGCPGRDSLTHLAAGIGDAQSALVLAHIRRCAPCFDEPKELRTKTKP
jgi:hypothetical protein